VVLEIDDEMLSRDITDGSTMSPAPVATIDAIEHINVLPSLDYILYLSKVRVTCLSLPSIVSVNGMMEIVIPNRINLETSLAARSH
jgi:hypothetical protein